MCHIEAGNRFKSKSKGERFIIETLWGWGVPFKQEVRFGSCKDKRPMPFDFYFEHNGGHYLCEYHGAQHYKPALVFDGRDTLVDRQRRDNKKMEWARCNGFNLVVIPYTAYKIIEDILNGVLSFNEDGKEYRDKYIAIKQPVGRIPQVVVNGILRNDGEIGNQYHLTRKGELIANRISRNW